MALSWNDPPRDEQPPNATVALLLALVAAGFLVALVALTVRA